MKVIDKVLTVKLSEILKIPFELYKDEGKNIIFILLLLDTILIENLQISKRIIEELCSKTHLIQPASLLKTEFSKENNNFETFLINPNFYEIFVNIIASVYEAFMSASKYKTNFEIYKIFDYSTSVKVTYSYKQNKDSLFNYLKSCLEEFNIFIPYDDQFNFYNLSDIFINKNKEVKKKAFMSMNEILKLFKDYNITYYMFENKIEDMVSNCECKEINLKFNINPENKYIIDHPIDENIKDDFIYIKYSTFEKFNNFDKEEANIKLLKHKTHRSEYDNNALIELNMNNSYNSNKVTRKLSNELAYKTSSSNFSITKNKAKSKEDYEFKSKGMIQFDPLVVKFKR